MRCELCGRSVANVYRVGRDGEEVWVCEGELTPEEFDEIAERNQREP